MQLITGEVYDGSTPQYNYCDDWLLFLLLGKQLALLAWLLEISEAVCVNSVRCWLWWIVCDFCV